MLGHGSGGQMMKDLLEHIFFKSYGSIELLKGDDCAVMDLYNNKNNIAFSTDSFVVNPHFFAGGDIGKLAVCGTVNDVSTSGAIPKVISVSFILEHSYSLAKVKKICDSIKKTSDEAGVEVVTGDTKVVDKGLADGIYINTAGIGIFNNKVNLSGANCKPGDVVLVSGTIGDHGIAILAKREGLSFTTEIKSDCAPLNKMIQSLVEAKINVRCFRDPTRGGIASTLNEFAQQSDVDIEIIENCVPVKNEVKSACDMLGYDFMQVANEGKLVCVCSKEDSAKALNIMKNNKYGKDAAIIGEIHAAKHPSYPKVYVKTPFGTSRILDMLVGEQLPRIC